MAKIHLLSPIVANQIAAGEVIERPASVLKELLENSLDAKATDIHIDILQGGLTRMHVRDNGEGIAKEDLPLSLTRHATSKVATLDDLNAIGSLGFRGEALASIASIAKCVVCSKPKDQEEAWGCSVKGDDLKPYLYPAPPQNGTSIEVRDLFYNTPARRKFLKSARTEFHHIEQVVKHAALSYPEVAFTLTHNEKIIKSYKKVGIKKRIQAVLGQQFFSHAASICAEHQGFRLTGFVGNEQTLKTHTSHQYFFINQRPVRDKVIQHAVKNAFFNCHIALEHQYPSFVIFLEAPLSEVDINVHPTKHEVRFSDSTWVHDFIQTCVQKALLQPTEQKELSLITAAKKQIEPAYVEKPVSFGTGLNLDLEIYKPKSKSTHFWKHFYINFKEDLYVIDLAQTKSELWQQLFNHINHYPFPSKLCLFPKTLSLVKDSTELLESFGFVLKKNVQGHWMLSEIPAFLEQNELEKVTKLIETTPFPDLKQVLCTFFQTLPWQVFLRHLFFEEQFEQWCSDTQLPFLTTWTSSQFRDLISSTLCLESI